MGITGLLPALKSITETKPLEEYRGQTLAIDGYCWLHRAIYSCSQEICLDQETDKYIKYFIERVDMLRHNGITPYVVFDGGPLPMKKGTEIERRAARQKNRERGIQLYNERNFVEARRFFTRAADVSPFMAHRVIQYLKTRNVRYVVAPYEADAQLAYLVQNGLADGVITEDSDCLPFGCRTVLFKLDKDGIGLVQEIQERNLKRNTGLLFHMFTPAMFLDMCIFSGCDYLPSLAGFGLKKAYLALKQHGSFLKVIRALRLEGKVRIPPTYEADFEKAVLTFRHQRVFDPVTQRLVHLTPLADTSESSDSAAALDFLGPMLADDVAVAIALGDMDPITMEPFPVRSSVSVPSSTTFAGSMRQSAFQTQTRKPTRLFAGQQQQQVGRRLPGSFVRPTSSPSTSTSSVAALFQSHASASVVATEPLATSPQVVSRFFAAQVASTVASVASATEAVDESDDALALTASPASFESQEPLEVDVAQSVSLAPVAHKVLVAPDNKENRSPPPPLPPAPVVADNAFARMMRAGSLLQKQSLKRKAAAGAASMRHNKQSNGLLSQRHYQQQQQYARPAAQRIQRFAHTESTPRSVAEAQAPSQSAEVPDDTAALLTAEPEAEDCAATAEVDIATDSISCASQVDSSSGVVARGPVLAGRASRMRSKPTEASSAAPSMLASLDRFRFKP